jgi:phosphoserine phosphatase
MRHLEVRDGGQCKEAAFTDYSKTLFNEIILIEADAEVIAERRGVDATQEAISLINHEADEIRRTATELARETGAILRVIDSTFYLKSVSELSLVIRSRVQALDTVPNRHYNIIRKKARTWAMKSIKKRLYLFDADGTIFKHDVSEMFMQKTENPKKAKEDMHDNFRKTVRSFMSYIYHNRIHWKHANGKFDKMCQELADEIVLYPGAKTCLQSALLDGDVAIITAGIPKVWRIVMEREGLGQIAIFGLVKESDQLVMDEQGKEAFADELKKCGKKVIAIGDSVIDLGMMNKADHSFLITGEHHFRKMSESHYVERYEITKMYLMLGSHPSIHRIASDEHYQTIGPRFVEWTDVVPIAKGLK